MKSPESSATDLLFLGQNKLPPFKLSPYVTRSTVSAEVLRSPEVDVVLQMLPHKCQKEGKNHFCSLPHAAGHSLLLTPVELFVAHEDSLLTSDLSM